MHRAILLAIALVFALPGLAAADHLGPGMGVADHATGGGLEAAAIGELGDTTTTPPFEKVMDLPALDVERDAEGRIIMDLPGITLVGPPKPRHAPPAAPPGPDRPGLPVTGVNAGDLFALGAMALSAGGVLLRRVRLGIR